MRAVAGAGPAGRGAPHRQHGDRRLAWPPQARHRREFLAVPALCRRRGVARIDWRRSARDDHTYVRDREWEAAHTVWLWADPSPSMLYKSRGATVSKESRALVLILALAELLSRSGERIAWPGLTDPFSARNGAERLAAHLSHAAELPAKPDLSAHPPLLRHRHRQRFPRSGRGDHGLARRAGAPRRARPSDRGRRPGRGDASPMPAAPNSPIPRPATS